MRKYILIVFAALPAFFAILGCEKEHLAVNAPQVKALKTELNTGQYDTLYFTGANGDELVQWTVTPDGFSSFDTQGNTARIIFTKDGTYIVSAQTAKTAAASISIKVNAAPDTTKTDPISGDVSLALNFIRNAKRDSVKFNFSMVTGNTFCPSAKLQYNAAIDSVASTYKLDLLGVKAPKVCPVGPDVTLSAADIFSKPPWFGLGTYLLKVTMNDVTYTGTIVLSSNNIVITWNYTSGVDIPIKTISG